jgi:hypothetical protein
MVIDVWYVSVGIDVEAKLHGEDGREVERRLTIALSDRREL